MNAWQRMCAAAGNVMPATAVHRLAYTLLPRALDQGGFQGRFFNHGYAGASDLELAAADVPERNFIQLYHHITRGVDIAGKVVLEVGCGRGGGCYYLSRYRHPARLTGIDYSSVHIGLCRRLGLPNASFHRALAESFTLTPASVDVVVNCESAHAYASIDRFMANVCSVLRPGGRFAFADFIFTQRIPALEAAFAASGLRVLHSEDLRPGVIRSIETLDGYKDALRARAGLLRHLISRDFLITTDSETFRCLQDGRASYLHYLLEKPAAAGAQGP